MNLKNIPTGIYLMHLLLLLLKKLLNNLELSYNFQINKSKLIFYEQIDKDHLLFHQTDNESNITLIE